MFAPVAADLVPTSLTILTNGVDVFTERCVRGIRADSIRMDEALIRNTALATALAPTIGYQRAADVAERAVAEGLTIKEAALAEGVLDEGTLDRLLDPLPLTEPGYPGE